MVILRLFMFRHVSPLRSGLVPCLDVQYAKVLLGAQFKMRMLLIISQRDAL